MLSLLYTDNPLQYEQYKTDYELWLKRISQGLEHDQSSKPKIAKGFIFGMPDFIQGEELYKSITERHSVIAKLFGTDNIGGNRPNINNLCHTFGKPKHMKSEVFNARQYAIINLERAYLGMVSQEIEKLRRMFR